MPDSPIIQCEQQHPLLLVADLPAALEFYTQKLGFTTAFLWGEPLTMAGINIGQVSVHLSSGEPRGNSVYFNVGNADELFAFHHQNGVEIVHEPGDRDYEMRDYAIRDPWGNILAFGHPVYHMGDAVFIERVDVPVRLEKRLAALLHDLAAHKKMTVGECLEETLLHTFEVVDNNIGVASPHTSATHAYIKELKEKHGIDYDVHASYRFKEL